MRAQPPGRPEPALWCPAGSGPPAGFPRAGPHHLGPGAPRHDRAGGNGRAWTSASRAGHALTPSGGARDWRRVCLRRTTRGRRPTRAPSTARRPRRGSSRTSCRPTPATSVAWRHASWACPFVCIWLTACKVPARPCGGAPPSRLCVPRHHRRRAVRDQPPPLFDVHPQQRWRPAAHHHPQRPPGAQVPRRVPDRVGPRMCYMPARLGGGRCPG